MNISVFTYDFPHKKSQDFLVRLWLEGISVANVVGAPPVKLRKRESTLRVKVKHTGLVHPAQICRQMDIPYSVMSHDSQDTADLLRSQSIDVVVIAGARILKPGVIAAPKIGIINLHPGLLPGIYPAS